MSMGIGTYNRHDSMVDKTWYGIKNGTIAATGVGVSTLAATSLRYTNNAWTLKPFSPTTAGPAVVAGAGALAGMVAGHVVGGSDDQRFYTQIGVNAAVDAVGAAGIAFAATKNPFAAAGFGVVGAVAGALSGGFVGAAMLDR